MKILEINSWVNGSTGKIMLMIADNAREKGYEAITVSPKNRVNSLLLTCLASTLGMILALLLFGVTEEERTLAIRMTYNALKRKK